MVERRPARGGAELKAKRVGLFVDHVLQAGINSKVGPDFLEEPWIMALELELSVENRMPAVSQSSRRRSFCLRSAFSACLRSLMSTAEEMRNWI